MRLLLIFLLSTFYLTSFSSSSNNDIQFIDNNCKNIEANIELFNQILFSKLDTSSQLETKLIAVGLAITLGVFGVHRLYLGTRPLVPISYTLTLGGGMGLLPIIDIINIIITKDINSLKNNHHVFIWNKNEE